MKENDNTVILDREVKLTEKDLLEVGEKIAQLDAEEDLMISEKKLAVATWGSKLKANNTQRKSMSKMFRDKVMVKSFECRWENNYEEGIVEYFSTENGDLIHSRELTEEERQMNMFGGN